MARRLQLATAWAKEKGLVLLSFVALWHVAGCVIPPPEVEELENQPPIIDWSLTVPVGDEIDRILGTDPLQFDISGAVDDPEGDAIETLWYWVAEDGTFQPEVADAGSRGRTMTINNPCDRDSIAASSRIEVAVAVSDLPLEAGDEENPVITSEDANGELRPIIKRVWVVNLTSNTCP